MKVEKLAKHIRMIFCCKATFRRTTNIPSPSVDVRGALYTLLFVINMSIK